jgi:hypothetical protein
MGAFDEFPVGARPAAMGGAFTAVADDAHSLYYNPAGLATLYRPEVTAYYARLYPNLSDQNSPAQTFIGAAGPIPWDGRWGGVGAGYQEFRVDSLFKERTLTLAYGKTLLKDRLALGMGLKSLDRTFGNNADTDNAWTGSGRTGTSDPVFQNGHSASALGVDLGALYALFPTVKLGLSLMNINRPDLGLTSDDRLPFTARFGAAYDKDSLKVAADFLRRSYLDSTADNRLQLGAERSWAFRRYGILAVRGGAGMGTRDYRQVNLGAGYEVNGIVLDYVFTVPLGAADDTGNLHNISLSYKFGRAPAVDELDALILEEKAAAARAEESFRMAEAEASFIREERDRLLVQYSADLERLKNELDEARRAAPVAPTVRSRTLTPEERERLAREKAQREYAAAYDAAYRAYEARVSKGASLAERLDDLNGIIAKYRDKGVNVSQASLELEKVKSELAQVSTDYRITLDFYKKTVAQGADAAERQSLLERMVAKFKGSGIDITEVKNELEKIKTP